MPYVDFASRPYFIRPELLIHPQIPRPLSGVAPRNILGEDWWNANRKAVYAINHFCCWACGSDGQLEAHECYRIDYEHARMYFEEVVALCTDCHTFIHLGRAGSLVGSGRMTEREFKRIIRTRYSLLEKHDLRPGWQFYLTLSSLSKSYIISKPAWLQRMLAEMSLVPKPPMGTHQWEDWRMVLNDKEYAPLYHNEEEVLAAYKEA